jgi:outer membrane protein TolC
MLVEVRVREARGAAQLADERYRRGVEKLLVLLDTERRRRIAENEEILVRGDLWNARVDLFLALGGDWP